MTADEFRELALALPGVVEGEHMQHPDFRVQGRVFTTLGYPNDEWGMVKVEPADQKKLVWEHGQFFVPVKGAWGLQGSTNVKLAAAQRDVVAQALDLAWQRCNEALAAKPQKTGAKAGPERAAAKKAAAKAVRKTK